MTPFTKVYRFAWLVLVILLVFFNRNNSLLVWGTLILLVLLTVIAVYRALESRNEWRQIIIEEGLEEFLVHDVMLLVKPKTFELGVGFLVLLEPVPGGCDDFIGVAGT